MTQPTKLHPKQAEIALCQSRYKIVRAGRRAGKSHLVIEEMKAVAVQKDNAVIYYFAPTITQARDIIWESLKKEFSQCGAKINNSLLEIVTPNMHGGTSLIKLTGWETVENRRGVSVDLIIFDELDTMAGFLQRFQEVVKPLVLDRKGRIIFVGTPKDSNPNLQSLQNKYREDTDEWSFFHFTSYDNPHLDHTLIDKEREALSLQSFRQEWLAEYGDGSVKLFDSMAVESMFNTTLRQDPREEGFLIVDPAGMGDDHTCFGRWKGMEVWLREEKGLRSDDIIEQMLQEEAKYQIPRPNLMLDGVGLGDSIADRNEIRGSTVFKGSYSPIKTDKNITKAIGVQVQDLKASESEFANLRTQVYFALARAVNTYKIKVHCSVEQAEQIKRELSATVELEDQKKKLLIPKDDIKRIIGHSPDKSDVLAMRFYYDIIKTVSPAMANLTPIGERKFMTTKSNKRSFR